MHKETIFTCSPPRYQLERTVQKDRVNQTQSVGQGTRQSGASLLKIHPRLRELRQGSLSVSLSFYQRRQRQIMRQVQYLFPNGRGVSEA